MWGGRHRPGPARRVGLPGWTPALGLAPGVGGRDFPSRGVSPGGGWGDLSGSERQGRAVPHWLWWPRAKVTLWLP